MPCCLSCTSRTRLTPTSANERKTLEEQIEALRSENQSLVGTVDELTVGQSFASSSFIKDNLVLTSAKTRALYGSHFEMKDGELVGYDKPAGSTDRTPLVDAGGDPLSFDEALKRLVESDPDKDTLLRAKGNPGAGSRTQQIQKPPKTDDNLHGAARIAAALSARKQK